ncbi:MAG: cobalamin-dependent protein [Thermoanaerobaculia bacterium]
MSQKEPYLAAILAGDREAAVSAALREVELGLDVRDVYVDVLQESLYEVGRLWERNEISVATEHLATAITQRVVARLWEHLPRPTASRGRIVLAGVEGELHQVGGLMVSDALEADGWDVMFLGSGVPASRVLEAVSAHRPVVLGITCTLSENLPRVSSLIASLRATLGDAAPRVVVGGGAFRASPGRVADVGADGWAPDIRAAIEVVRELAALSRGGAANEARRTPLTAEISGAVSPILRRLGGLPFFEALRGRTLSLERYVDALRGMAVVTAALESAAAEVRDPAVRIVAAAVPARLPLLLEDLAALDPLAPRPDDPEAAAAALALAREVVGTVAETPVRLFGLLWVAGEMAIGNKVLLEEARATAGGAAGTAWYAFGGSGEEAPTLRERLDALGASSLDGKARAEVVSAAVSLAEGVERLYRLLDPRAQPGRRPLATTYNPEAGVHEVADDPAVSKAALRAGERCLDEFPYLRERYGERGERYTRSDVSWLAALSSLDEGEASRQLLWLTGVLSRRGMPTIVLERQLLLLDEELAAAATSAPRPAYREVARELAARREAALPARAAKPIGERFVASAGHGTEGERQAAARVLLAAAADEIAGWAGALAAVTEWYRGERVSEPWTSAVDALVRDALAAGAGPALPRARP